MLLAQLAQPRRAGFLAHFKQQLEVEPQAPVAGLEHLLQGGEVDAVLALVIGGAAAVPALAFQGQIPRVEAFAPLLGIAWHHIAMAVAEHGAQRRVFQARGNQERPTGLRVAQHLAVKTQALQQRLDFFHQVTQQFAGVGGVLAVTAKRHPAPQVLFKVAVVQVLADASEGSLLGHCNSGRARGTGP